jgi:crotonobetainyl-CoA:carnitine CoA-transferase CaiB-like acyl-CoA transferase
MSAKETRMTQKPSDHSPKPGMLQGLRVVETADELGEYCGVLLAGLGAEVIKIEPAEGSPTRRIGPFYEDVPGQERSLFFWAYNRGKKSVQVTGAGSVSRQRRLLHASPL